MFFFLNCIAKTQFSPFKKIVSLFPDYIGTKNISAKKW